jgi:hypothetical protein
MSLVIAIRYRARALNNLSSGLNKSGGIMDLKTHLSMILRTYSVGLAQPSAVQASLRQPRNQPYRLSFSSFST